MKLSSVQLLCCLSAASAFTPSKGPLKNTKVATKASSVSPESLKSDRPLYDPLGLYPKDAPERVAGLLNPIESSSNPRIDDSVTDPLNIYKDKTQVDENVPMSASVPFLQRPAMLDGSLPGDRGFDPFNFSSNPEALQWYRNAEVKHARIAMLAAAGWPLAELFHKNFANAFDLKPLLSLQDRVPSVLNGGLGKIPFAYWVAVLAVTGAIEAFGAFKEAEAIQAGETFTPGDLGFDPLGLFGKTEEDRKFKLEAELFNGRLGMLAITGFAIQEWLSQTAVIDQTPIFFKPIGAALTQLMDAAGNGGL